MTVSKTVTANAPQFLHAYQINSVGTADPKTSQRQLLLADGRHAFISSLQAQSFLPSAGDYYVVPSEGHPYCVSKATFLQNYTVSN